MSIKLLAGCGLATTLLASTAFAGGIERSAPSTSVLFQDGRYAEFSLAFVSPKLEGTGGFAPGPVALTGSTGDLFDSYATLGAAYRADVNDKLGYALILDQPFGASTSYPAATGALPAASALYQGSGADLETHALTGALIYEVAPNVSIYGGLRVQRLKADAQVPFAGSFDVATEASYGFGYMAGVAYEKPEIALRVALTYYSEIDHDLETTETSALTGGAPTASEFSITTPDSLQLEFQTGVAPGTLVFGSIRWVDWSEFNITPNFYPPGTLVQYTDDWTTYTLGVGRQLTDTLAGSVSVTYEPGNDTVLTSLGPVDGRQALNLGLRYKMDNMTISGGVSYIDLGDTNNSLLTQYSGGSAIAAGFKIGFDL